MTGVATFVVGSGALPTLAGVHAAARDSTATRLWLLHRDATPASGTLPALLAAGRPAAVSVALDPAGRPHAPALGVVADHPVEPLLVAVRDRVLPLRYAPVVSLLVERDRVLATAAPDPRLGPYAQLEWTARLFKAGPAFLVAASTVTVPGTTGSVAPLALARLARRPGFGPADALRQLHLAAGGRVR